VVKGQDGQVINYEDEEPDENKSENSNKET
jgi:hypothetical protein